MNLLSIKRIYAPAEPADGYRILIDRLWPRGIKKEDAQVDEWAKSVTPTTSLRQWFGHKEENYAEFAERYRAELNHNPAASDFAYYIRMMLTDTPVTLLYGAKSETCNHAIILRDWILSSTYSPSTPGK